MVYDIRDNGVRNNVVCKRAGILVRVREKTRRTEYSTIEEGMNTSDIATSRKPLKNKVGKASRMVTTYSMTTDVRIGYLEFNELVDSEISTVQIDLDVYLQFVDISLGTVGAVEKYDITFPSIQDQVKPIHLYFSDRNVDNTITYNHTTYTPSVMGISNELISPHINGTYTHDIPVRIQTILDIPSVNGYIYELRASFKTVDINPQFKNSTRVSLLTGQNP